MKNPKRKAKAARDFRYFCRSYFPEVFYLPFSADHEKVIKKIQRAVLEGGLFAMAMPRGSGKSALCAAACLWATIFGHHEYAMAIGATEGHGSDIVAGIRVQLETNDLLAADFPEVCHPIRRLEGITQRRLLYRGKLVRVKLVGDKIVLPDIEGSPAASAIIGSAGLTGRLRGTKFTRPDGREVRPSLVLLDDPQTDDSAKSPPQIADRLRILNGAVLGLAAPGQKISGMLPCTVILNDDMADQILDRKRNPQWQGERTKMVHTWPGNQKLWDEYAEIRARGLREDRGETDGNAFYRRHRKEMDKGAEVAWPQRKDGNISAIQNAWNMRLDRGDSAFFAEYQNSPIRPVETGLIALTADKIASKLNNISRGTVTAGAVQLTAFVDVQQDVLFWLVAAWEADFTGAIVDYGSYPDQLRSYWTLPDLQHPLASLHPGLGMEGTIYAGLDTLVNRLMARAFTADDSSERRISKLLIDANWGDSTKTVYQFCRQSTHGGSITPSHGRGIGAGALPMDTWQKKPGETHGLNWVHSPTVGRPVKHVTIDTNFWKSFIHWRLSVAMGDRGGLSLPGSSPEAHKLLADQLTAEKPVRTEGRGRKVDEWKCPPGRDNHFLDCLVGAAVAASMQGICLKEHVKETRRKAAAPPPGSWSIF